MINATETNPFSSLSMDFTRFYGSLSVLFTTLQAITERVPGAVEVIGMPGMGRTSLLRHLETLNFILAEQPLPSEYQNYPLAMKRPYDKHPNLLFPILIEFDRRPKDCSPAQFIVKRFLEAYVKYKRQNPNIDFIQDLELPQPAGSKTVFEVGAFLHRLSLHDIRPYFLVDDFDKVFPPDKTNKVSNSERRDKIAEKLELEEVEDIAKFWRPDAAFILTTEKRLKDINQYGSLLFGSITTKRVEGPSLEEAKKLIRETMKKTGYIHGQIETAEEKIQYELPEEDIETLLSLSGLFPYLMIQTASQLWDMRHNLNLLTSKTKLPPEHVLILKELQRRKFDRFYQSYWDAMNDDEKFAAKSLADGKQLVTNPLAALTLLDKGLIVNEINPEDPHGEKVSRHRLFSQLFTEFISEQEVAFRPLPTPDYLSGKEKEMFEFLAMQAGYHGTIDEIHQAIWGSAPKEAKDKDPNHRIHVLAHRLKKQLDDNGYPYLLKNERSNGYRLYERLDYLG